MVGAHAGAAGARTGSAGPAKIGGYRKPVLSGHEDLLRELTESKPGITLAELQASLVERGAHKASLTSIWTLLRKLGQSHKKGPEGQRTGPSRHRFATTGLDDLAALYRS